MTDIPSIWTLTRAEIEATLVAGRSARREYSDADKAAIREVLDRPDFDHLDEYGRSRAFEAAGARSLTANDAQPVGMSDHSTNSSVGLVGWTLVVAAAVELLVVYFGYDTAIHSAADFSGGSFLPAHDTINIGLLQNQLMLFLLGLAGLMCGTILVGVAAVMGALRESRQPPAAD